MFAHMKSGIEMLIGLTNSTSKRQLKWSVFFEVLSVVCSVVPIIGLYSILTAMWDAPDTNCALLWACTSVAAIFLKTIFHGLSTRQSHKAAFETLYFIRVGLLKKISRLPMGFMDATSSGKVKNMVFDDVETLEQFYAHNIPEIMAGLGVPIMMTVAVFFSDWRIGVVLLIPFLLYILAVSHMQKTQQKNFPGFFMVSQAMNNRLVEYITGMKEIRTFSCEGKSYQRLSEAAAGYEKFVIKMFRDCFVDMSLSSVLLSSHLLFVLPVAGALLIGGQISTAAFVMYLFVALCIGMPLAKVAQYFDILGINIQAATNIGEIMNLAELDNEGKHCVPEGHNIVFEHVNFSYLDKETLSDVSFTAPAGKVTALVGASGGGKSTIAKLIARFWDVGSGSISIGSVDVKSIAPSELSKHVAFVTQNVTLFEMSVADNIRLGNPGADMSAVIEAAKEAQCHEFIISLSHGYDTVIGSDGVKLSGGEKQRISIARALLKDAPVLLLDEATAYADADNEDLIKKAISRLSKDKTVILIAHRLSTVAGADQILLVDKGRVVASGTHDELLKTDRYRGLWERFAKSGSWRAVKGAKA